MSNVHDTGAGRRQDSYKHVVYRNLYRKQTFTQVIDVGDIIQINIPPNKVEDVYGTVVVLGLKIFRKNNARIAFW